MKRVRCALAVLALAAALPSYAGPATDALLACVADNTSGKERKEFARWIFAAMSAHPDMQDLSNATPAARDQASAAAATVFTRLVTQSCASEYRAAMKVDGAQSLGAAFELLGKLAMQELMTNNDVRQAITGIQKFVDRKKVEAVLGN